MERKAVLDNQWHKGLPSCLVAAFVVLLVGTSVRADPQPDHVSQASNLFYRVATVVTNGELLGLDSRSVGLHLKGASWATNCSIKIQHSVHGNSETVTLPWFIAYFFPGQDGWSPYQFLVAYAGAYIDTEEEAVAFLRGHLAGHPKKGDVYVREYVLTDVKRQTEFVVKRKGELRIRKIR